MEVVQFCNKGQYCPAACCWASVLGSSGSLGSSLAKKTVLKEPKGSKMDDRRRENECLKQLRTLSFHESESPPSDDERFVQVYQEFVAIESRNQVSQEVNFAFQPIYFFSGNQSKLLAEIWLRTYI